MKIAVRFRYGLEETQIEEMYGVGLTLTLPFNVVQPDFCAMVSQTADLMDASVIYLVGSEVTASADFGQLSLTEARFTELWQALEEVTSIEIVPIWLHEAEGMIKWGFLSY